MLAAALLLSAPALLQEPDPATVERALERGAAFLEERLLDARKRRSAPVERYGMRALCLYALIKSGRPAGDETVRALLWGLARESTDQTYDTACLLLALVAHDPIAHRPWIEDLAADLERWQEPAGDWSYPGLIDDLSNTQFAALGLWAAERAGVSVDPGVWRRLAGALLRYQDETGGFSYTFPGKGATGSMTAAGVGTEALCEARLRVKGELDRELEDSLARSRAAGLAWLAEHFDVGTNPRSGAWQYYWLYGLERVTALAGTPRLSTHEVWSEGARWLCAAQDQDGAWNSGTDLSETAFALLFLARATSADDPSAGRGPLSPRGPRSAEEHRAAVRLRSEGEGPVRVWIEGFDPAQVNELEASGQRGLGPRVARVEYRLDGSLAEVLLGDGLSPAGRRRFAFTFVPRATGPLTVTATVLAVPPGGGPPVPLTSAAHTVVAHRAQPAWLARASAPRSNRVPGSKPKARGSSEARQPDGLPPGPFGAAYAVDGNRETPWLTRAKDQKRTLTVTFRKAPKADRIALWPPVAAGYEDAPLARPTRLEVKLAGKVAGTVEVAPGEPAFVDLERPRTIKRLDVRILEVDPPEAELPTGLGEIGLHLRP